jgi:hypothetical protein
MKLARDWSRLPNAIFAEDMPAPAFRLLCFLFRRSDDGGRCFPSYQDMRRNTFIGCDSTIKKYLDLLAERGWIIGRKHRYHSSTLYVLAIPERLSVKRAKASKCKIVTLYAA